MIRYDEQSIISLLNQVGIRVTAQRIEIATILMCKPQHLCADEILQKVNQESELVSKATVYNTLNLFVEKGLIHEVNIDSQKVFYDSNTRPHCHIYNEDTGELIDFDTENMIFEPVPTLPEGTIKTGVDVVIRVKSQA